MFSIPQSTSFILVFKAFLSSDHVTEATGKTIAVTISKAGGSFGNLNVGATNATEIASGWYKVTLDTTDTGTLGVLAIRGSSSGVDDYGDRLFVVKATNGGLTALPDTAVTTNASLITSGSSTAQLAVSGGAVTTVTTVTNQLTAAQIATGVWQDTTAGDFTVSGSIGKSVMNGVALGTGLTVNDITTKTGYSLSQSFPSNFSSLGITAGGHITTVDTVTTVTNQLTAAAIATGVWQDTTAGDFTTSASIGKSIMNGVALGTGLTVNDITTKTGYSLSSSQSFNLTGNITGNLSGSVGSVTGAVGSISGVSFPTNFSSLGISVGGHISNVDTLTTYTGNTVQTGDAYARIGAAGAGLTALGDTRIAHLDADVSSRSTFAGGAVASVSGDISGNLLGSVSGTVAGVVGLNTALVDAAISSRLASGSYTAPDNTSITGIKAKTDSLTFSLAGKVDANILNVNGDPITGDGDGTPWGPA